MNKKDIQPADLRKDTSSVFRDSILDIIKGITGITASNRKEIIFSISRIFQGLVGAQRLSVVWEEWDRFKKKGCIKEDYQDTEQHKDCLLELLQFLEKDLPDKVRFSVLKQIFLVAATEKIYNRDSSLPLQFMQICKKLSTGEILTLQAVYNIYKSGGWDKKRPDERIAKFRNQIAKVSELKFPELVGIYETNLMDKALLTERAFGAPQTSSAIGEYYRLTSLGYELCRFIEVYSEESK